MDSNFKDMNNTPKANKRSILCTKENSNCSCQLCNYVKPTTPPATPTAKRYRFGDKMPIDFPNPTKLEPLLTIPDSPVKMEEDDDDEIEEQFHLVIENGPILGDTPDIYIKRYFGLPTLPHLAKYHHIDYIKQCEFWYEVACHKETRDVIIKANWKNKVVQLSKDDAHTTLDAIIEVDETSKRIMLEEITKHVFNIEY